MSGRSSSPIGTADAPSLKAVGKGRVAILHSEKGAQGWQILDPGTGLRAVSNLTRKQAVDMGEFWDSLYDRAGTDDVATLLKWKDENGETLATLLGYYRREGKFPAGYAPTGSITRSAKGAAQVTELAAKLSPSALIGLDAVIEEAKAGNLSPDQMANLLSVLRRRAKTG